MKCKKCGNEILEGEKFCGKCGTKVEVEEKTANEEKQASKEKQISEEKQGSKKKTRLKFIWVIMAVLIIIAIIICINLKSNNGDLKIGNMTVFSSQISNEKLTEMLKSSENGIYLQKESVKVGVSKDFNYNNYNKLVSYSCIYVNGAVTLNSGGLLMLNDKTDEFKIVKLSNDYLAILYYLNTENEKDKLSSVVSLMGDYINSNGVDNFKATGNKLEEYMELGKKTGEIVGVELCRDITREATIKLVGSSSENGSAIKSMKFFYKKNEISPRYLGCYTTEQVYNWSISETAAKILYSSDRKNYNNMVAIYGQPYKTVKKFTVYDFTKENTPTVGSYDSEKAAEDKLGVEQ